jgi:metallo-beta-lactamase family protein
VSKNEIKIRCLGAAGTVTGSKYLIEFTDRKMLVDCGLFQGLKELRLLNWEQFPVNPSEIDMVLLTHGHLDHVGYLPRLVAQGFNGKIHCTEPTFEIAKLILEDSAKIQEEEAERANAKGYSKHHPAKPLYTLKDVELTTPLFETHAPDSWINLPGNLSFCFRYNSHIIGATFIELKIADTLFVFSGDVGRDDDLLMYPPKKPQEADVLFIESTYGDRVHPLHPEEQLKKIIATVAAKHGTLIIPGFAVERIQMLMYMIWKLKKSKQIPDLPIYMDSPMGKNVLDIFYHHESWHKLSPEDCIQMSKDIKLIKSMEDTIELSLDKRSKIVIAGSGMSSGGRVLTYFQYSLEDPNATVLLVGYQAEGTRGRKLLEGAKEIKVFGKFYKVKATIENIEGLSAHADQKGLINWLSDLKQKPKHIFIVHGEPLAAQILQTKIKEHYGWDSKIPALNDTLVI